MKTKPVVERDDTLDSTPMITDHGVRLQMLCVLASGKFFIGPVEAKALVQELRDLETALLESDAKPNPNPNPWREVAERLRVFALHYRSHPKRNPDDKLDEALDQFDALIESEEPK